MSNLGDECEIASGAEPDVVRKHDRVAHVVVSVNGVDAIDERDAEPARLGLEAFDERSPGLRSVVGRGIRRAPAEDRAELIRGDVCRCD